MKPLLVLVALAGLLVTPDRPAGAQAAIDAAALSQAHALMEKIGMVALSRQILAANMVQMQKVLETANPGKAEEVAKVMPRFAQEFDRRVPGLVDLMARVYALHFTANELSEINAFYDRPVGQKLVKQQPQMIAEFQAIGAAFGRKVAEDVLRTLRPELEKRDLKVGPFKT